MAVEDLAQAACIRALLYAPHSIIKCDALSYIVMRQAFEIEFGKDSKCVRVHGNIVFCTERYDALDSLADLATFARSRIKSDLDAKIADVLENPDGLFDYVQCGRITRARLAKYIGVSRKTLATRLDALANAYNKTGTRRHGEPLI